jgi:hypothetical protein
MEVAGDYLLDQSDAEAIVEQLVETIRAHWADAADACWLTAVEATGFWAHLIINPDINHGLTRPRARLNDIRDGRSRPRRARGRRVRPAPCRCDERLLP